MKPLKNKVSITLDADIIDKIKAFKCRQWDLNPHVVAHNRF